MVMLRLLLAKNNGISKRIYSTHQSIGKVGSLSHRFSSIDDSRFMVNDLKKLKGECSMEFGNSFNDINKSEEKRKKSLQNAISIDADNTFNSEVEIKLPNICNTFSFKRQIHNELLENN